MSAATPQRLSCRQPGEPKLSPAICELTLAFTDPYIHALELLAKCAGVRGPHTYARDLLKNEIERAFEEATGMRLGVFVARCSNGERFVWSKVNGNDGKPSRLEAVQQ